MLVILAYLVAAILCPVKYQDVAGTGKVVEPFSITHEFKVLETRESIKWHHYSLNFYQ